MPGGPLDPASQAVVPGLFGREIPDQGPSPAIPTYYYLPSGTQLQVRARSTGSSGDLLRVALYTFDA